MLFARDRVLGCSAVPVPRLEASRTLPDASKEKPTCKGGCGNNTLGASRPQPTALQRPRCELKAGLRALDVPGLPPIPLAWQGWLPAVRGGSWKQAQDGQSGAEAQGWGEPLAFPVLKLEGLPCPRPPKAPRQGSQDQSSIGTGLCPLPWPSWGHYPGGWMSLPPRVGLCWSSLVAQQVKDLAAG